MNRQKIEQAIKLLQEALQETQKKTPAGTLRWGSKVSQTFKDRVIWIGEQLGFDPNLLMDCIAFESAETFRPDIKNAAGSGATGLIQFMPSTARTLRTTTEALARMTAEDQLNYVYKYFEPYKGKLKTLADLYMAILWPRAVGKDQDFVLFRRGTTAYSQNIGLDVNRDGVITKAEAAAKVIEKSARGESFRG